MTTCFNPLYKRASALVFALIFCFMSGVALLPARAETIGSLERERGRTMLDVLKSDIKKNYYDPSFRGVDLDAKFKAAEEKIKQATSNSQIFGIIAQVLLEFDDSHTFFLPPQRSSKVEYGWKMQMIGDQCYVTAVEPGSDAEAKGLKVGDLVYSIDGFEPTRQNHWKIQYSYYTLKPKAGMRLVVISPDGKERQLDVMAKVTEKKQVVDLTGMDGGMDIWDLRREAENEKQLSRHRFVEFKEDDLYVWKMPAFDLSEQEVDKIMEKVKDRKALILDLRGNPGGYVITLQRLLGHFFEKDLTVGTVKTRKDTKPMVAKTRGDRVFKGKLVVLVDSRSASCSELFSRVIQIEKRGTVIGDKTAGAVMRSRRHSHQLGMDTVIFYGASITNADLIMTDGKSLEHAGVDPDELLLPKAIDIASQRDPVLTRAAQLLEIELGAEQAGKLFPIEWKK
jgi:C-terminal processing protease CtpA/Prc